MTPELEPPDIVRRAAVHMGDHGQLVLSFLAVFARFEFALKRCGMLRNLTEGSDAQAGWDQLSSSPGFEERFQRQDQKQRAAIKALLDERPKKQVVSSGLAAWRSPAYTNPEGSSSLVLQLVRNVRNNLFHGGKFPLEPVTGPERNPQLIADSLVVLDHALQCAPAPLQSTFDDADG